MPTLCHIFIYTFILLLLHSLKNIYTTTNIHYLSRIEIKVDSLCLVPMSYSFIDYFYTYYAISIRIMQ